MIEYISAVTKKTIGRVSHKIRDYINDILYAEKSLLTKFGDVLQVSNPVLVCSLLLTDPDEEQKYEKTFVFLSQLIVTIALSASIKAICKKLQLELARRPSNGKFNGLPSGHTASAAIAPIFAETHMCLAPIPRTLLWAAVPVTMTSRLCSRDHTAFQIISGVALPLACNEAVKYIRQRIG